MSYFIHHRGGEYEREPTLDRLSTLYDELKYEDDEHPDVSLTHESEWSLGAFGSGLLVWENVAETDVKPRHMKNVSKDKTIELWKKLAQGKIEEIDKEPWLSGYG